MTRYVPAEWSGHRAMWVGFPSHPELWLDDLVPAQAEVATLARTLASPGGERVRLMVVGDAAQDAALRLLDGAPGVEVVRGVFGDLWLRDTGPIFYRENDDQAFARAAGFRFNGWGGKYELEGDDMVAEQIAAASGAELTRHAVVVEGGALDHDGRGTVLTTRQCLLNPNRNAGWTEAVAEAALAEALGARRVLWLGDGLLNDHTDGHVDNLARFVAPGVVACPVGFGREDPNTDVYAETARMLSSMRDARGDPLQVVRIPAPGRVELAGEIVPASHMNFVIAERAVVLPIYNDLPGQYALEALKSAFPEREVIALPSRHLLSGGGSFHCITQQEPA